MTEDRPALAALLMVGSLCLLGLQDSLFKLISGNVSLWQFHLLRAGFNLFFLLLLSRIFWRGASALPKRPWAVILRSIFLVCSMLFFFGAIPSMSLSEAAAGLYVFPLFIILLSSLFLGERLSIHRGLAITGGFAGTILILKPLSVAFHWITLSPVIAALFYAATIIATRKLCREENPATLAMIGAIAFAIAGAMGVSVMEILRPDRLAESLPYLFSGWSSLSVAVTLIILLCSMMNLAANIGLAKAYQSAESSWLAPFDYSYLVFAAIWGALIWNDVPDAASLLGMAMIAGSGCYVLWRERIEGSMKSVFPARPVR